MNFISTRGQDQIGDFLSLITSGLAQDGGLFQPKNWPEVSAKTVQGFQNLSYQETALEILAPFVDHDIPKADLIGLIDQAYSSFSHPAITPLKQIDNRLWMVELFHGPTLAFKDVALQLLGQLFNYTLAKKQKRLTILGATSGDTGSAAIHAFKSSAHVDVVMLHPHNRTSAIQRKQMTCVTDDNIHNIAIKGDFDDCQNLVKEAFGDVSFRDQYALAAVNSINLCRILAQTVYYFRAAALLGSSHQPINIIVPTGNFGNIYAAHAAQMMGAPIKRKIAATNRNDILARFFNHNDMSNLPVEPSLAPSMDIQISSNFERFLYDNLASGDQNLNHIMAQFKSQGRMPISDSLWQEMKQSIQSDCVTDEQILTEISNSFKEIGEIIDPHTATATHVARNQLKQHPGETFIVMATAHHAKFPQAIELALGRTPPAPTRLKSQLEGDEKMTVLDNSLADLKNYCIQHL